MIRVFGASLAQMVALSGLVTVKQYTMISADVLVSVFAAGLVTILAQRIGRRMRRSPCQVLHNKSFNFDWWEFGIIFFCSAVLGWLTAALNHWFTK
jgi:hypothetical protein